VQEHRWLALQRWRRAGANCFVNRVSTQAAMEKAIDPVNQQIAEVKEEIKKVGQDIVAEGEWRKGGPDKEYWQKTVQQFRDKEGRLQEKDALLLRASLAACSGLLTDFG
jgi:polyhydroxyalkanoate synthesis regulator phasin